MLTNQETDQSRCRFYYDEHALCCHPASLTSEQRQQAPPIAFGLISNAYFCFVLHCLPPVCFECVSLAHKNRGITVNGTMGCVASRSIAVIRHSLAASCSFCASNTTPNTCLKWNYTVDYHILPGTSTG